MRRKIAGAILSLFLLIIVFLSIPIGKNLKEKYYISGIVETAIVRVKAKNNTAYNETDTLTRMEACRVLYYILDDLRDRHAVSVFSKTPMLESCEQMARYAMDGNFFIDSEQEEFWDSEITREEVFIAIVQIFGIDNLTSGNDIIKKFSDFGLIHQDAVESAAILSYNGILCGYQHQLLPKEAILCRDFCRVLKLVISEFVVENPRLGEWIYNQLGEYAVLFTLIGVPGLGVIFCRFFFQYRVIYLGGCKGSGKTTLQKKLENRNIPIYKLRDLPSTEVAKNVRWRFFSLIDAPENDFLSAMRFLKSLIIKKYKILVIVLSPSRFNNKGTIDDNYVQEQLHSVRHFWVPLISRYPRCQKIIVYINKEDLFPKKLSFKGKQDVFKEHIELIDENKGKRCELNVLVGSSLDDNMKELWEAIKD